MECKKPTKKYPNGRTGTETGYVAHRNAGEESCDPCRDANREYNRAYRERNGDRKRESDRRWREENLERKRENDRRYYKENADKIRKRARDWHHSNKEYANARSKAWREENPEQARENVRRWHEENPEQAAEWREKNKAYMRDYLRQHYVENRGKWKGYGRKRRSLKRNLPQEDYSIEDIVAYHGKVCYLCLHEVDPEGEPRSSDSPHVDHVHPLSVGGCPGDVLENVRLTHAVCNVRKGARLVEDLTLPFVAPIGDEWEMV